jgi:5-methylcytosine-specific restriction protein B
VNSKTGTLTFEEAFQKFVEEWEDNPDLKIPTKRKEFTIINIGKKSISFKKASGGSGHSFSINTLRDIFYGKREYPSGLGVYYPGLVDKIKSYQGQSIDRTLYNYVLIIDEINRGNVSQIFGELITLLEPDKRLGMAEQLRVMLPYSGEEFGVPPNLYIIGTMNTADRSVEALDTALRRRFSFEEMPPRYDLRDLERTEHGIKVSELLQTLNARIEKLIDRDHLIGHSYFMDRSISLKEVFQNKIIPLLQEYFFGDYGKIGLVLGRGFVEVHENKSSKVTFAEFDYDEAQDLADRRVYRILWPDTMNNAEFQSALQLLMNKR